MAITPFYPASAGATYSNSATPVVNPTAGSGLNKVGAGLVASGVISGLSEIATTFVNAQRTKNTYKFNADMAGLQDRMLRLSADVEIKNIRKKAATLFSEQRAGYARAGFDIREGSPVAVMLESQKEMELDAIYADISATYNVGLQKTQGDIYNMQGQSAMNDAWTNVGSTILNTGTKIATRL